MAEKVVKKSSKKVNGGTQSRAKIPTKKVSIVVLMVLAIASVVTVAWLLDINF